MKVEETFVVPAPRERVWQFFDGEIERAATCMPGVESMTPIGDDRYKLRITQKVGFISATFDLTVQVTARRAPDWLEFSAVGRSLRGAAGDLRSKNRVELADEAAGGTRVTMLSDVALGGMLGSLGHKVVASKAREVTGAFAKAVTAELARSGAEAT